MLPQGDGAMTCGGYIFANGQGTFADAVIIGSLDDDMSPPVTLSYSNLCGQSWLAIATNSVCSKRYHSAYVATSTESDGVKIDGFLHPNFM